MQTSIERADGSVVRLRPARIEDLAMLRHWDAQPHVQAATGIEADDPDAWDWAAELSRAPPTWRELLLGEVDRRPVGVLQIIDPAEEETRYWGDVPPGLRAIDIWIGEASDIGRGYGRDMMRLALARCFAHETVSAVLIDPLARNVRARQFYARIGFRDVERRTFGSDDSMVMRLERGDWLEGQRN